MSMQSLNLVRKFSGGVLNAEEFSVQFFETFQKERDSGALVDFEENEMLTTIFCNLDLFNPEMDREYYEINEMTLLNRIQFLLSTFDKKGNISEASEDVYLIR